MFAALAMRFPLMADTTSAANIMRDYVAPIVQGMCVLATLVCVFFLINGAIQYMSSSGQPDRLESAKNIIRNALLGLIIVLAAGVLTAILAHAYHQAASPAATHLPALSEIKPDSGSGGLVGVLLHAITGVLNDIIQTAASPFLKALNYFTSQTPLIADNSAVFNLWLAIVGIADAIFVLIVALLGFRVMSFATFGLDELEFKHLLPRIAGIFLLMNSSVFLIDGLIAFSNAMIHALQAGFSQATVWDALTAVVKQSGGLGLAALLVMVTFLILAVILLVYYVGRIVTLYLGAVLSPLVFLVWLIPGFRDFAETAFKTYLATIFVLFVHVVILELAASLFSGMVTGSPTHTLDPLMAMVVGLATLVALLKTQGVMMQLSYASVGPRTARRLGGQFMTGVSYMTGRGRAVAGTVTKTTSRVTNSATSSKRPTNAPYTQPKPYVTKATKTKQKTGETRVAPKIEPDKPKNTEKP